MCRAFSLVELSIVLVILGLLVGGVLSGQSLIRGAELRAVTTEYQRYATAVHSFRDKYFALPGDMTNATDFWGRAAPDPNCGSVTSTDTKTCNGDGNGYVDGYDERDETYFAWKQLANAGLIEGQFSNRIGPQGSYDPVIGVNIPSSKLPNAGWHIGDPRETGDNAAVTQYLPTIPGTSQLANVLMIGAKSLYQEINWYPVLKPEEAWNIDTKIDDGKPFTGKVSAYYPLYTPPDPCISDNTPSSAYLLPFQFIDIVRVNLRNQLESTLSPSKDWPPQSKFTTTAWLARSYAVSLPQFAYRLLRSTINDE